MQKVYETMPHFASEREEAEWWDAHADELDGSFEEAAANGTLMDATQFREMLLRDHDLVMPDALVRVPLSDADVIRAKKLAAMSHLSAEQYIGQIVHEALQVKHDALQTKIAA